MKRDILTLTLLLLSFSMWAQVCTELAFGFGNNQSISSYNVSGDIEVIYDAATAEVTLNLGANFSTANGPDVRAYLVNSDGLTDAQLVSTRISALENVQFGLTMASGEQTFTIPAPTNIEEYDKIFFYCLQFDQFWDFGSINPFPTDGCITSSTRQNFSFDSVEIYPNPATNFVNVKMNNNADANGEIGIYNIIGNQLIRIDGDLNQNINLEQLAAGIYTIQVKFDDQVLTKRLVVND